MMRRLGICLMILFSYLQSYAVDAVVSHSVFYIPDYTNNGQLQPSIETSWQINPRSLHYFTNEANMYMAHIKTDIVFTNDAGKIIREDHFVLQTIPRHSVEELDKHSIIDLRRYVLTPGKITMRFRLTDLQDSTRRFVYTDSFTIAPIPTAPFYSDMQLLDTILNTQERTVFYKNGHQQVPSGTNYLGDGKNLLHYYTELYKTNDLPASSFPLIQRVFITKREEDPSYKKFRNIDTITKGQSMNPAWGSINIEGLTSGNFYLRVTLETITNTPLAAKTLFFQRMNTHPVLDTATAVVVANDTGMESVNVLNLNKTFVAKFTLSEIRAILKMLLPISDVAGIATINGFLKKPDEMYMRYYIYNYFLNINKKDPGKAWKEYATRVKEVNKLFTAGGMPGYETDRGIIYLRYGPPTDIMSVENENNVLPYEVWQYNELREMSGRNVANAAFLYYRPVQMISGFKLLHSTVIGEMLNPTWRTFLYKNYQADANFESRAELFFSNR